MVALRRGLAKDSAQAVAWWEKAALHGNVMAQVWMGTCLMKGEYGVPKNVNLAKYFMKGAAAQGDAEAAAHLKVLRACAACGRAATLLIPTPQTRPPLSEFST